jgi:hypothetical protein
MDCCNDASHMDESTGEGDLPAFFGPMITSETRLSGSLLIGSA